MKFFILFIILFGCTNSTLKPSGEFKKNMPNYLSSDTFDITCYKTLNNLKLQNLIFLEACYIKYSQKKSDEIAKLYGSGELPLEFNFDTGKKNLYFALKGDTISIRILYMYNYEGFINEPLSAIETKGVVVLGIKGNIMADSTKKFSTQFKFSEMKYKFLRPNYFTSSLVFKSK